MQMTDQVDARATQYTFTTPIVDFVEEQLKREKKERKLHSRFRRKLRSAPKPATPSESPRSVPPQLADIQRVLQRVHAILLCKDAGADVDGAISALLRDTEFGSAWTNANIQLALRASRKALLEPMIHPTVREAVAGFHDELQMVATAFGEVLAGVFRVRKLRPEFEEIGIARLMLPSYLDDAQLPVAIWQTLRSRDAAAVCYIALIRGIAERTPKKLLAEYAQRHRDHQLRWLDLLSWMYGVQCPVVVPTEVRHDWEQVFRDAKQVRAGRAALLKLAKSHPEGFALKDTSLGDD